METAAASAPAGGAPVAGLSVDRPGAARLLLGCRDGLVAGRRLLFQAGLSVVRADPVLRAGAVGSGPDSEFQVVCSGLHRRWHGGRGGAQQKSRGGFKFAHLQQGPMVYDLYLVMARLRARTSDGASVEVRDSS